MRILIDFTQIPLKKVGVGVYGYNLITWIDSLNDSNEYYIIIQNDDNCFSSIKNNKIKFIDINNRFFRFFVFRVILEQVYIPFLILTKKIDILHSLHYSFPLISFKAKRVVTVHDLTFFLFPRLHTFFKRYYFRLFTNLSARFCDKIICVSNSTKLDLIMYTKLDEKKVKVIHLGRDEIVPIVQQHQIVETCTKYNINIDKKYILFIGTIEPRKNILTMLKVFCAFRQQFSDYQLVIVGRKGWYFDDLFKFISQIDSSDIIFTGFIEAEEKPILLMGADFFVYPSLYEGFGIPVLEALSCCKPTITSNVSSMPEVAGDAALLIDPNSEEDMLSAFIELATNMELRKKLINKCPTQVEKFSWRIMTLETIATYNSIVGHDKCIDSTL